MYIYDTNSLWLQPMDHFNPSQEKDLLIQYNSLKQQLSNCHIAQKTIANQINSITFQIFGLVSDLISALANRIEILQGQYKQTRQHLSHYEDSQYLDSKYPYYQEMDTNLILQGFERDHNGAKFKGISYNMNTDQNGNVSKFQNISKISTMCQKYEHQDIVSSIGFNQGPKLEDNQSVSLRSVNRIGNYISKYPPLASSSNVIQTKQAKEYHKLRIKKQFTVVAEFVHRFLVPRLQYDEDHSRFTLPKKLMLKLYQNWCQENKRQILLQKSSVIQMSLTNQLKIAFPSMDSYTKNYRGLKFINNGQNKRSVTGHPTIKRQEPISDIVEDEREDLLF